MSLHVKNIVVGPAYPECLYTNAPHWHVDWTIVHVHADGTFEQCPMRRTFNNESAAREWARVNLDF